MPDYEIKKVVCNDDIARDDKPLIKKYVQAREDKISKNDILNRLVVVNRRISVYQSEKVNLEAMIVEIDKVLDA